MNPNTPKNLNPLEEGLYHYLVGHFSVNPNRVGEIMAYPHWREKAAQELERRHTRLLEALDGETLHALAEGKIDMARVAALAGQKEVPHA